MEIILESKFASRNQNPNLKINDIHMFIQFFIDKNNERNNEISQCLKNNIENPYISNIHLLNEKIFSNSDMGIKCSSKIKQVNIGKRLKFKHVFKYIRLNSLTGYFVIANTDIFFDSTIEHLKISTLHNNKHMFALLRYEYDGKNTENSLLFGPRFDSQDTWIFHSNNMIKKKQENLFNFEFGKPGCDNKIIYIMNILSYEVINDPTFIKIYHYHRSQIRNYSISDIILPPWGGIIPAGTNPITIIPSLGIDLQKIYKVKQTKNENWTDLFHFSIFFAIKCLTWKYSLVGEIETISNIFLTKSICCSQ
jgi:hypothetical protein